MPGNGDCTISVWAASKQLPFCAVPGEVTGFDHATAHSTFLQGHGNTGEACHIPTFMLEEGFEANCGI